MAVAKVNGYFLAAYCLTCAIVGGSVSAVYWGFPKRNRNILRMVHEEMAKITGDVSTDAKKLQEDIRSSPQ